MAKDPNAKNRMGNSTGKGWSPPAGQFHPPAAGAHKPETTHRISGGYGAGGDATHPSLKKKK